MISQERKGIRVFAPASVANVAVGYDILGFPITGLGDELVVRPGKKKGLLIKSIHGNKELSRDIRKNTAGYSAMLLLESLGMQDEAIELELYKNMGLATGLGSSAASAVAGAFGVNEFLGRPYERKDLLPFVTASEQLADGAYHADNVAPSLMGSMILVRDNDSLDFVKLPVPSGLKVVIVYPRIRILTKESRSVLSRTVALDEHIRQSANLGAFVAALYRSDFDLMQRSLVDIVIEKQRKHLIPHFDQLKELAEENDALGCSISGAGPSVFCICKHSLYAEKIKSAWEAVFTDHRIEHSCFITEIDTEGARLF